MRSANRTQEAERRTPKTWKQVADALHRAGYNLHPNTCKKIYYRETGERPRRVARGTR
jgi:hypothetical protein